MELAKVSSVGVRSGSVLVAPLYCFAIRRGEGHHNLVPYLPGTVYAQNAFSLSCSLNEFFFSEVIISTRSHIVLCVSLRESTNAVPAAAQADYKPIWAHASSALE